MIFYSKLFVPHYIVRQTLIASCLNIAQIVKGYAVGWSAPVIPKLQDINQTPLPNVINSVEASLVTSFTLIGIFGYYVTGYVSDIIGRRPCLIIGGFMMILSYGLQTIATNLDMIYAGRFFVGFSSSFLALTSIIYVGEIASPNIRGIILTSAGVFHALGSLIAYCVGPFVSYTGMSYVPICITAVYIAFSFFLPESPVYHVIKGNEDAARDTLQFLGRSNEINNEFITMIENAKENINNKHVWRELFTVKGNRRGLFVTVPLFFFQQSNGIIPVIVYSTTIFKDAGSSVQPEIATIIVGATLFIGTIFSPMIVEKYGRKILLIVSVIGCGVTMAILGVYFHLEKTNNEIVMSLRWLPLLLLVISLLSFGIGITMIPNTLTGELFQSNVRGLGSSIALSVGWMSSLLSSFIFEFMVEFLGNDGTFWIFAAVNVVALAFVIAFVPETKGKTLIEIDAIMND